MLEIGLKFDLAKSWSPTTRIVLDEPFAERDNCYNESPIKKQAVDKRDCAGVLFEASFRRSSLR